MKVALTLRPGQNGTKALQQHYGDRLVAVRYRYDTASRRRIKTAEVIVDEADWLPPQPELPLEPRKVFVRIEYEEFELRRQAKSAGAHWDRDRKLWELTTEAAQSIGLTHRIVAGEPNQGISSHGHSRSSP